VPWFFSLDPSGAGNECAPLSQPLYLPGSPAGLFEGILDLRHLVGVLHQCPNLLFTRLGSHPDGVSWGLFIVYRHLRRKVNRAFGVPAKEYQSEPE